jgi:hypothetical protein
MASYKVPQDVEADDKLIGPFSFRQFVYIIIAVAAGGVAFLLGRLALPLAIIPLPIFFVFGLLALPLRKDQPMEIYVAAVIRFLFKPHVRLWDADVQQNWVEITNPIEDDSPRLKDIRGQEVLSRLSFLAEISDTQGWATRGVTNNLSDDYATAADDAVDILDEHGSIAEGLNNKLSQTVDQARTSAIAHMQEAVPAPNITDYDYGYMSQPTQAIESSPASTPTEYVPVTNSQSIPPTTIIPETPTAIDLNSFATNNLDSLITAAVSGTENIPVAPPPEITPLPQVSLPQPAPPPEPLPVEQPPIPDPNPMQETAILPEKNVYSGTNSQSIAQPKTPVVVSVDTDSTAPQNSATMESDYDNSGNETNSGEGGDSGELTISH